MRIFISMLAILMLVTVSMAQLTNQTVDGLGLSDKIYPSVGSFVLVEVIPIGNATLYNISENQYNRFLTQDQRTALARFNPNIDMYGNPFRYDLKTTDIIRNK